MNTINIKKDSCILIIAVLILLNVMPTKALDYSITYSCEKNQCIEGKFAEWNISINNNGPNKIEIVSIELRDSINNSLIALFNTTYRPLSDKRGNLFVIPQNQQKIKMISAELPGANNYTNLVYYACFTNTINEPEYTKKKVYSLRFCYDEKNEVMPVLECVLNSSCPYNKYCRSNKCIDFKCKDCQYKSNHKCVNYECCGNDSCKIDELCTNNNCAKLNCGEDEYSFNHSCRPFNCAYNEFLINNSCKTLNCSEDEFVFNRSCVKLNCSEDEFVFNRSCVNLKCMFNETAVNHSCKPLNCYFFQKKVNHQCANDKQLIFKLSIELVVILVIIALLIMDVRRYESKVKEEKPKVEEKKPEEEPMKKPKSKDGKKGIQQEN